MKKVVLKLDLHDEKAKQKAMKTVSGLSGVDSVAIDLKDKKLTVIGDIDPVVVVAKLRKFCHAEIVTVGPAKEPEKKKDEKKDDRYYNPLPPPMPRNRIDDLSQLVEYYQAYYNQPAPPMPTNHYHTNQDDASHRYYIQPPPMPTYPDSTSQEEDPGCVIC